MKKKILINSPATGGRKRRWVWSFFEYAILIVLISAVMGAVVSVRAATQENKTEKTTTDEGDKNIIKSIEFVNNKSFKNKKLKKKLDFEVGDFLDPILAESGRRILTEFYQQKGFADVKITLDKAKLSEGRIIYTIDEGKRLRIKSIKFEGNKFFSNGDLRRVIKLKTRNWLLWPVYYNQTKVATALEKLRTLYYQKGFLNHRIEAEGRTNITFIIEEGPRYDVRNIYLTGNEYYDDKTLLSGLKLEPGHVYFQQQAEAQVDKILQRYNENGFVNPQVREFARFVPEPNVVDVEFKITEGNQFRIGRIEITGNENTQDKVIRRVLDEYDFTPGQLYNADLAPIQGNGKLEKYVQSMTLADQAIIKPVMPSKEAEDSLDVQVDIKEGLTGLWSPGIMVGSDSGVIGQFIWEQRNFDITDWPESFKDFITMNAFKGAGQSLRVALEPGTEVSYYSISFSEPYLRNKPTALDVSGSSFERWRESYDEKRTKGFVGLNKRYKSKWNRSIGFRIENVKVEDLDFDAPQEIIDVKGNNGLIGVNFGFGRDMTDNRFDPTSGYTFNASYEQVTGEHDFGILSGTVIGYKTLYEDLLERKTVLAGKLLGGTTLGDAPPFEKFYAGGTGIYGISGFDYRGVSTRGLQTHLAPGRVPLRKDPIGSDWIFLADVEVTVPLIGENLDAVFFLDSGTIDTGRYRAALGTGIQISIPQLLGTSVPMRFELAWPFMKDDSDETRVFSFTMGRLF
jgi:outer membrane protein insertion porin family